MTISTNPQIVMLWQGVILDFSEADSPRVQSATYLPEMGNNVLSQNCSHANNKHWRNLLARKGQGCWQFAWYHNKSRAFSTDLSQNSIDSLNYAHTFKPKTADHQPWMWKLKSQLPPPHTSMLLVYKAPHCGKLCQNLRETKSSQPAVLHHNILTIVCRNILSLKSERDEENWVKSCKADFKEFQMLHHFPKPFYEAEPSLPY